MIEAGRLEDAYAAMHAATRQQLLLEQFMMMFGAWGQMGQALSRQETRLDLYQDPPGMTGQVLSVFYAVTYSQARFTVNVGLMQDVDGTWRVIGAYAAPVPAAARGDTANAGS
jgi:DNA gyrase inhibitor GyrI